jgi:hypothetical protein
MCSKPNMYYFFKNQHTYIYVCMYVCMYVYIYMHTHRYKCMYMYIHMHTHKCLCMHMYMHLFLKYTYLYAYTHICINIHTYVHTYSHINVHMYIFKYMYSFSVHKNIIFEPSIPGNVFITTREFYHETLQIRNVRRGTDSIVSYCVCQAIEND